MLNNYFKSKLTATEQSKVNSVASSLNVDADWLAGVMLLESNLKPTAKNPTSGAVGLIQFTRDKSGVSYKTIAGKKYELSKILEMSFSQQMDLVYLYYKPYIGKMTSFANLYLVTFFPLAIDKTDDFVFQTSSLSASLIASQNAPLDTNHNNQITKSEFENYVITKYASRVGELPNILIPKKKA